MKVETIKKSQRETTGDRNPRKEIRNHRFEHQPEYKRWKRESQVQKIPQKTSAQQSKKIQNAKKILTQNIQEIHDAMRRKKPMDNINK